MLNQLSFLTEEVLLNPVGLLFVIVSMGLLLGRVPIAGFRLGGSGVLLVGLVFGHFGHVLAREIQTIGVVLFVYSIGLRAGPNILEALRKSKGSFFVIAFITVAAAGAAAVLLQKLFHIPSELISGIYAGALTSTPALAAAMETTGTSAPSVGYGLAYPLGMLGVIAAVQIVPALLGVDLHEEEKKYAGDLSRSHIVRQSFKITNPNVASTTFDELLRREEGRFRIVRVKRGEKIFTPHPADRLELDDIVLAVGEPESLKELPVLLGEPVAETLPYSEEAKSRWLIVSSRQFVGRKIGAMEITHLYGVFITRVRRSGVEFGPRTNFVFEPGDEIRVSGAPADLDRFRQLVGRDRETVYETDIFSFALGLALGVVAGLIKIPVSDTVAVSLGIAGGPLVVGLLFGYFGRFGFVTGHMPAAARYIVGELGLYLFLAAAGSMAGEKFLEVFQSHGILLILAGLAITLAPLLATILVARFLLRLNMLVVLGLISGGMTSTPALGVISSSTKSDVPVLAYTGIYPLAVVFTTLVAQLLALA